MRLTYSDYGRGIPGAVFGKGAVRVGIPGGRGPAKGVAIPSPVRARISRWHAATTKALARCLAGQPPKHLPPLDLSAGTDFQQRVWQAMRRIALGQTWSYAQIAAAIGKPKAVRAVGGACGANPIPVFVPCHRVVAANQRLGGFSGGLNWKRKLLGKEGIRLPD